MNINECKEFMTYDEEQYLKQFGTVIRELIQGYNLNTLGTSNRVKYVFIHDDMTLVIYPFGNQVYFLKGYETVDYMQMLDSDVGSTCTGFTIPQLLKHGAEYMEVHGRLHGKETLRRSAQEVLDMIKESK